MEGLKSLEKYDHIEYISNRGKSIEEEIRETIITLTDLGHHVIIVYPIFEPGIHVPNYILEISKKFQDKAFNSMTELLSSAYTVKKEAYDRYSKSTFDLLNSIKSQRIYRVYPHTIFCGNLLEGRCTTFTEKEVYFVDHLHPSFKGAKLISNLILQEIKEAEKQILNFSLK